MLGDAVAAANAVAEPLREGRLTLRDLERVERRRILPTRPTQRVQRTMQEAVIRPQLAGGNGKGSVAFAFRIPRAIPPLRNLLAYVTGVGFRPEHVRTQEIRGSGGL
jgi:hypothetical protein